MTMTRVSRLSHSSQYIDVHAHPCHGSSCLFYIDDATNDSTCVYDELARIAWETQLFYVVD